MIALSKMPRLSFSHFHEISIVKGTLDFVLCALIFGHLSVTRGRLRECLYGHYNAGSVRVSVASPGLEGGQILGKRLIYESGNMFARENIQVFLLKC